MLVGSGIALTELSRFAFSKQTKQYVHENQGDVCYGCGQKVPDLQAHHIVPQCKRGTDNQANAVGLGGEHSCDCHEVYDQLAIKQGIIYPGIPMDMALPEQRKQRTIYKKRR